jgi:hypothetical protein
MKESEINTLNLVSADCIVLRTEIGKLKHSVAFMIGLLKSLVDLQVPVVHRK